MTEQRFYIHIYIYVNMLDVCMYMYVYTYIYMSLMVCAHEGGPVGEAIDVDRINNTGSRRGV